MTVLPKSKTGKWSLWLFVAVIVIPMIITGMATDFRLATHVLMGISWAGLLASGILAVMSWVKKDRALLLLLPMIQLVFWALFLLGEILVPH